MPIDADIIKSLHKYEIRILHALERMMKHYRWVPEDDLRAAVKLSPPEMKYRLGNLIHRDLIRSDSVPYKGYTLVFAGYDALALSDLAGKKTISALGSMIGVGKESEIYEALGFGVPQNQPGIHAWRRTLSLDIRLRTIRRTRIRSAQSLKRQSQRPRPDRHQPACHRHVADPRRQPPPLRSGRP